MSPRRPDTIHLQLPSDRAVTQIPPEPFNTTTRRRPSCTITIGFSVYARACACARWQSFYLCFSAPFAKIPIDKLPRTKKNIRIRSEMRSLWRTNIRSFVLKPRTRPQTDLPAAPARPPVCVLASALQQLINKRMRIITKYDYGDRDAISRNSIKRGREVPSYT